MAGGRTTGIAAGGRQRWSWPIRCGTTWRYSTTVVPAVRRWPMSSSSLAACGRTSSIATVRPLAGTQRVAVTPETAGVATEDGQPRFPAPTMVAEAPAGAVTVVFGAGIPERSHAVDDGRVLTSGCQPGLSFACSALTTGFGHGAEMTVDATGEGAGQFDAVTGPAGVRAHERMARGALPTGSRGAG
jgi:hypothetical protein